MEHIIIIKNLLQGQQTITLADSEFTIGRKSSNSLAIKSHLISRYHLTILPIQCKLLNQYSYWVIDGNLERGFRSTNGIIVNNQKILMYKLEPGDIITLPNQVQITYQQVEQQETEEITENIKQNNTENIKQNNEDIDIGQELTTLSQLEKSLASLNYPTLLRLASFPELSSFPIIEISTQLEVTYINAAAVKIFNNLLNNRNHPIINNMIQLWDKQEITSEVVELIHENNFFEQHMHKIEEYQLIRSYIIDANNKKRAEKMLEYSAFHDDLTGLYNRRFFKQKVSEILTNCLNTNNSFAIIFFDLDRFKNINDALGHDFGDIILQSFALRLQQSFRADDILARWGGDEFIAILKNSDDLAKIREVIQGIVKNIERPFYINNRTFYLRTSIGISLYPQDGTDEDALLKHADAALYRSKDQGKAQYKFYTETMTSKALQYLNLENLLHQALANKELLLYYQPQINVETGKVTTMEALLRWQQSQLGMIYPNEFIPLAEDSRLIIPIGEWVLHTACQQTKIWQEAGFDKLNVSVNINYQQLAETAFTEMVSNILQQTNLAAKYLELEITETSLIKNINLVNDIIQNLQNMGVRIALDDFGVGYSSLNYLKQISFNILKLDKCFMENIAEETSRELAIISVIMILANKLNLTVICEGVETQKQLDILLSTSPNMQKFHVQGYFYSRPLSVEDATNFLHNNY